MRVSQHFIFLTFVLTATLAVAAPSKTAPKKRPVIGNENDFDEDPSPSKTEGTRYTYPRNLGTDELPASLPPLPPRGHHDLDVHIGVQGGDVLDVGDSLSTQYLGFRYIDSASFEKAWDFEANVHSQRIVSIGGGFRKSILIDDFFQSYWRVGVTDYILASDGLGGLINLRHFKITAGLGSSDLFEMHRKLCGEFGVAYGMGGALGYLQIGYNFNF